MTPLEKDPAGHGLQRKGAGVAIENTVSCWVRRLGLKLVLPLTSSLNLDLLPNSGVSPLGVFHWRMRHGCHEVVLFIGNKETGFTPKSVPLKGG